MIAIISTMRVVRRSTLGRLLAVAGRLLAVLVVAGWASAHPMALAAAGGPPLRAEIAHDKAFVSRRYDHCAAFVPSPAHCPFAVAATPNGSRGHLIAVDITQQTGDDCYRGRVFFFDGEHFLASTSQLPPHSIGGVKSVRSHGTARFKVSYWVSASAETSCAMNGNAGTDPYLYAWNGKHMIRESGTPPAPPKVIVGT